VLDAAIKEKAAAIEAAIETACVAPGESVIKCQYSSARAQ
jgi:hypothetical protein